ncbi:MAG: L-2-hydroxyglutarate oxidase [Cocleimonas sp.]|jgi:L-2-hydroxyglutarate oxidase
MNVDYTIIGGGIVGISTAWQLQQRYPNKSVLVLEKENNLCKHQTGRNSGVIHAGVYYTPGSLKAEFCREGLEATIDFCQTHKIEYNQCGKVLVATNDVELERMHALFDRCQQNNIDVEWLDQEALKEKEPNIVGLAGILVKKTGIVNYQQLAKRMATCLEKLGGIIQLNSKVCAIQEHNDYVELTIDKNTGNKSKFTSIKTGFLISCSGLMADRLTKMMGIETDFQIIPFRGEYYQLPPKYNKIVNHLIYPIPDSDLPFLGVHLTRMINGSVTIGPNAVQGWKREGYGNINVSLADIWEMFSFKGFWHVLKNNWKTGLSETKNSWYKPGYLKLVQKYCPQIKLEDLHAYPTGIRAQAVLKDGTLVHDFLFAESPRSLHVCNAPSPAATSAIPIGNYICDKILVGD